MEPTFPARQQKGPPMQVKLGVVLFGLPGFLGLLAPLALPGSNPWLVYPPSIASIAIALALWRQRHHISESVYLPLLIVGLSFDGLGLVGCHASATMALVMLPAVLWGSHYLTRPRDVAIGWSSLALVYAFSLFADRPAGVVLAGQWLFTIAYLTIAAAVTHVLSTRLNALVDESREASLIDSLTGLSNRRRLLLDLAELEGGEPHFLVLFDLNRFKAYNDSRGHLAGDDLLRRLAERFRTAVAGDGRAYRLGGDEFCAIVKAAGERAQPCLEAAKSAFVWSEGELNGDAAWGTALFPDDGTSATDILGLADRRMYARKATAHIRGSMNSEQEASVAARSS